MKSSARVGPFDERQEDAVSGVSGRKTAFRGAKNGKRTAGNDYQSVNRVILKLFIRIDLHAGVEWKYTPWG
jgi:hypothetical protein